MLGKKLTVYLANGLPSGIRHVEIANWSGQGIACPRSRLKDLSDWPEATRPGVYFLLEKDSGDTGDRVYIGESEDVQRRLKDHFRNKDFWNEAVLFTSKDDNLTKSHIMYLESRLTQMGISAGRFEVEAGKTPTKASLPRADRDAMEEFLLNVHIVLGALGHRVLESVIPSNLNEAQSDNPADLASYRFQFSVRELKATGRFTDEGFVLLAGSNVSGTTSESMPGKTLAIRNSWIVEGILEIAGSDYKLKTDQVVSSSSYAAAIVAGTSRSGPQGWFDASGKSLKQIEEDLATET